MKRRAGGGEHRFTQRITFTCPHGHRLGNVDAALVDLDMAGPLSWTCRVRAAAPAPVTRGSVRFRCEGCLKAGRHDVAHAVALGRVAALLTVLYVYGPAHVTTGVTRSQISATVRGIIPEGDPGRDERRAMYARLVAALDTRGASSAQRIG